MKQKAWSRMGKFIIVEGNLIDFKDGVKIFKSKSKKKWWLWYGKNHMTGAFKSKKACVGWYEGGGR